MILARKLRSAMRLYRSGGLSLIADLAWDQSRGYIESNAILPLRDAQRALMLTRVFNDRIDYPHVAFDAEDAASCQTRLLLPYLRRQFFDVVRLADLDRLEDADILLVADSLYRRWEFLRLDASLPGWCARLTGTKASPVLDMMSRRVALRLGRLGEAGAGLPRDGGDMAACFLRAEVFDAQGRMSDASKAFEAALHRQSDEPLVRLAYAFHLLKLGRMAEGFESWGLADRLLGNYPLRKRRQRWRGEDLQDRTLMIIFEHGLGDMIQMSRFIRPLIEAHPGGRIIGRVPAPLVDLMRRSFPSVEFVPSEQLDPAYDLYIPSMQLPLLVSSTGLRPSSGYIRLDGPVKTTCRESRPRVGVCWRGHPRQYEHTRSIPLDMFSRLFGRENVDFVVLLHSLTPEESSFLDGFTHVLRPAITDFVELGALIASCDLVVSVDTAVPHLAGAAGSPTLLLSRPDACWRWGSAGSRSAWYDTIEILRHPGDMDWGQVLAEADRRIGTRLAPAKAAGVSTAVA